MSGPGGAGWLPDELAARLGVRPAGIGNTALWGPALALREAIDREVVRVAAGSGGIDIWFPPVLAAETLDRLDWFRSFPHLATFAMCLDGDEANVAAFAAQEPIVTDGAVHVAKPAPVRAVLSPAACYHIYEHSAGALLTERRVWTTRNTCHRNEAHFVPLERQWSFTMRELVCAGTEGEVRATIEEGARLADDLSARLDLPTAWMHATDPFFRAPRNPKHLLQCVDPVKHELVHGGRLAIASTNFHYDTIARAFDIRRQTDRDGSGAATTGCVAFGLERWVAAVIDRHGSDPASWPAVADPAATRAPSVVLAQAAAGSTPAGAGGGRQ